MCAALEQCLQLFTGETAFINRYLKYLQWDNVFVHTVRAMLTMHVGIRKNFIGYTVMYELRVYFIENYAV